jgi:hypothetical protein
VPEPSSIPEEKCNSWRAYPTVKPS